MLALSVYDISGDHNSLHAILRKRQLHLTTNRTYNQQNIHQPIKQLLTCNLYMKFHWGKNIKCGPTLHNSQ